MNPEIKIVNCTSGEEIVRKMTNAEFASYKANQTIDATLQAESEAKAAQRQAILDRLGLTADEAKLILG